MSHLLLNNKRLSRGTTLLEALIAVGIFALLMLAMGAFSRDIFVYNTNISSSLDAQQSARQVLRQISSELKEASQSSTGGYAIEEASNTAITFYSDLDNDTFRERVRYYVSGDQVLKSVLEPSGNPPTYSGQPTVSTVITDLDNGGTPVFSYYDSSYDGTGSALVAPFDILSVRLVKVAIIIERDPNRSPVPVAVTTQIVLRNLKDNL